MNELAIDKTMTVREVAEVLGVSDRTIRNYADKLRNDLSGVRNPQGGYMLNEMDVTKIKLTMQQNQHLGKKSELPKTQLEKYLLISQAMHLLDKEVETLKTELTKSKPKIEFFDQVTNSKDAIDIGSAAKVLHYGGGRNKLFAFLRGKGILMGNNQPYQEYIDRGYFRTIEQKYTKPDGSTHINIKTVVYQKGLNYIKRILG